MDWEKQRQRSGGGGFGNLHVGTKDSAYFGKRKDFCYWSQPRGKRYCLLPKGTPRGGKNARRLRILVHAVRSHSCEERSRSAYLGADSFSLYRRPGCVE